MHKLSSSNFGLIRLPTAEFDAFDHLKTYPQRFIMGNDVSTFPRLFMIGYS